MPILYHIFKIAQKKRLSINRTAIVILLLLIYKGGARLGHLTRYQSVNSPEGFRLRSLSICQTRVRQLFWSQLPVKGCKDRFQTIVICTDSDSKERRWLGRPTVNHAAYSIPTWATFHTDVIPVGGLDQRASSNQTTKVDGIETKRRSEHDLRYSLDKVLLINWMRYHMLIVDDRENLVRINGLINIFFAIIYLPVLNRHKKITPEGLSSGGL